VNVEGSELRRALAVVARVLEAGEHTHKPGADNHWLSLSAREHVRRAMIHAEKFILGILCETDEDELAHAAVRLLLALERRERDRAGVAKHGRVRRPAPRPT
jgi:hypothetical protein